MGDALPAFIIALFTAFLLYLALRWLVILPLQDLSADMIAFRRAPEEPGTERPPTRSICRPMRGPSMAEMTSDAEKAAKIPFEETPRSRAIGSARMAGR